MKWLKPLFIRLCVTITLAMIDLGHAWAGTGPKMPWDSGLSKLVKNLTGKTALAIGVLAMFSAAAALVFGGEISEFTRRIILMILAVALMVSGTSLLNIFFGVSGALVW
jgi:type IV secretion system protein TrbC